MIATYPLRDKLASFEFFNWLVMVKADGATEIVFDISEPKLKNFTLESVLKRFRTIVEPGPAMANLPYHFGFGNEDYGLRATASDLLPWVRSGRSFCRLKSVKSPVECKYTITIRENFDGARARDSNKDAWYKFGEEIGAVIIDDYFVNPIHLHDRFALYAGAKMNFGVCNGPVHTISLTKYPVTMVINSDSARRSQTRWGLAPDHKYPWMLPNQHMVWKEDSLDNLLRIFEEVC